MLIPIPIATKHAAAVRGTVWKYVTCEQCHQPYAYLMQLEASGQDHDLLFLDGKASAARAQQQAEENFAHQCRNVVLPVPCPQCGFYQADMSQRLKDEASINLQQIGGVVILLLAFVPLAFDVPHAWLATIVIGFAGLVILVRGCAIALRFDPNAGDPGQRQELGRTHSVWGPRLAEVLAARSADEPASESERGAT